MNSSLKRTAQLLFGTAFLIYWLWTAWFSWTIFSGNGEFEWGTFALLLVPEIAIAASFFWTMWPEEGSAEVPNKFLSVFSILIMVVYWVIGPLQSFFTFNITGNEISFVAFLYFVEVVLVGALFIWIVMRHLKRVRSFMDDYVSDIKSITKERVHDFSHYLSGLPVRIAWLGFLFSMGGYILGSLELVFWGKFAYSEGVKDFLIGTAMSPLFALMLYMLTYKFLGGVYEILYSFGDVAKPERALSIRRKIVILSFAFLAMAVSLFLPLVWNFIDGNMSRKLFYIGAGTIFLELVVVFYVAAKTLADEISRPLEIIKKGMEILQTGEERYRINARTGDELEEIAYEFNEAAKALEGKKKKR